MTTDLRQEAEDAFVEFWNDQFFQTTKTKDDFIALYIRIRSKHTVPKEPAITFEARHWEMAKRRIGYLNESGLINVIDLIAIIAQLEHRIGYIGEGRKDIAKELYDSLTPEEKAQFDSSKIVLSTSREVSKEEFSDVVGGREKIFANMIYDLIKATGWTLKQP